MILSKIWFLFFVLILFLTIVTFDSAQEKPVALHYGGEVTPFYSKGFMTSLVEPALEDLGAIIVAPDCPSKGWTNAASKAARHPDLFSAAIPISAPAAMSTTPIIQDVPLYIIHGEKDELFPSLDVKLLYHKQKNNGAEIEMIIVAGVSHYQLARFITPLKATIPWIRKIWENR